MWPSPIAIIVILVVAGATIVLAREPSRASTGALSRETRRRDERRAAADDELEPRPRPSSRRRDANVPTRRGDVRRRPRAARRGEVIEYEPVDEEELGVTRRQFLNRGIVTAVGFGLAGFGAAMLAFLWPHRFGGLRRQVQRRQDCRHQGLHPDERGAVLRAAKRARTSQRTRRTRRPRQREEGVQAPRSTRAWRRASSRSTRRCVHLGCRVPWCQSSQWFECPCHGSKYNRVGEKKAGPAPRGLDRFALHRLGGGEMTIDTGIIHLGPPIGTNTTGQQAEGPLCV